MTRYYCDGCDALAERCDRHWIILLPLAGSYPELRYCPNCTETMSLLKALQWAWEQGSSGVQVVRWSPP